jgi:hypothetical protein
MKLLQPPSLFTNLWLAAGRLNLSKQSSTPQPSAGKFNLFNLFN